VVIRFKYNTLGTRVENKEVIISARNEPIYATEICLRLRYRSSRLRLKQLRLLHVLKTGNVRLRVCNYLLQ